MKSVLFVLSILFVAPGFLGQPTDHISKKKLDVAIYYEALCPYSIKFIEEQFYPSYIKIGESLNVTFVPFGNAKMSKDKKGNWKFTCQHGPKECRANTIQACALWQNGTQSRSVEFVDCIMSSANPERMSSVRKCSSKSGIDFEEIKMCVSNIGNDVLAYYGDITANLQPPLPYVPYIVFNGVSNETVQDFARDHFLEAACSYLSDPPGVCHKNKFKFIEETFIIY